MISTTLKYVLIVMMFSVIFMVFFIKNIPTLMVYSEVGSLLCAPTTITAAWFTQEPMLLLLLAFSMLAAATELIIPALASRTLSIS